MPAANNNPHLSADGLVARARAGDRSAFDELVLRYRARIYALSLHLTGNDSDADDVTQEVFLKAYQKLDRFEGRSQFFTWVYRMAVNRSLNAKRDRTRRRESALEDPRIELAVAVDAHGNPDRAAELRQSYARLLAALDHLPHAMRATVVLVALQGMSHQEAAVIQACSPGTIAWRIFVARQRLQQALDESRGTPQRRRGARESPAVLSGDLCRLLQEWGLPILLPS
jgi:RNA polymerase sigma-70 factor (ECF subfamily)